jgi:hypothetical protein
MPYHSYIVSLQPSYFDKLTTPIKLIFNKDLVKKHKRTFRINLYHKIESKNPTLSLQGFLKVCSGINKKPSSQ